MDILLHLYSSSTQPVYELYIYTNLFFDQTKDRFNTIKNNVDEKLKEILKKTPNSFTVKEDWNYQSNNNN
jgi:hypothetical protein